MRTRNPIKWLPALTAMTLALSACEQEIPERPEATVNDGATTTEETATSPGGYKLQDCVDNGSNNC
ncbi:MAG: hypothetical protein M0Q95_13835 [Porticoccaceae bacterium]|nr:hypothetical protein [Porticoccaceae bacterium]